MLCTIQKDMFFKYQTTDYIQPSAFSLEMGLGLVSQTFQKEENVCPRGWGLVRGEIFHNQ